VHPARALWEAPVLVIFVTLEVSQTSPPRSIVRCARPIHFRTSGCQVHVMIVTVYNLCVPDRVQSGRSFSVPGLFQRDWLACEFVVLYALFERIILHFWRRLHRLLTGHIWVRLSCTENEWGLRKAASYSLVVNANVLVSCRNLPPTATCQLCVAGKSSLAGQTVCSNCSAGFYSNASTQFLCTECSIGTAQQ